jgi:RNA polymerase sigma-70 factor (ECF subfamily)
MTTGSGFQPASPSPGESFATTHWTAVQRACRSDTTSARKALEKLCQAYWFPLYAYVRRRGHSVEDAQDLTQEFFARLLERQWLARADESKGRFRTFLLTALERFLANEWDKARALKRGGGRRFVPVQFGTAETRYGVEPADERTPEQAFEYRWALTMLEEALKGLEADFHNEGEAELFTALKPCLVGDRASQPYAELALKLEMTESAIKVAVHRLRRRYRDRLRAEVAQTVLSPGDVDAEMRHLFNVLAAR